MDDTCHIRLRRIVVSLSPFQCFATVYSFQASRDELTFWRVACWEHVWQDYGHHDGPFLVPHSCGVIGRPSFRNRPAPWYIDTNPHYRQFLFESAVPSAGAKDSVYHRPHAT